MGKHPFPAWLKCLLVVLSAFAAAGFLHFARQPLSLYGVTGSVIFAFFVAFLKNTPEGAGGSLTLRPAARPRGILLGGLRWSRLDFCRGWLITGRTGSSKTRSGINRLLYQVFLNEPTWGGLCIDDKGLYWETLCAMAKHFGREKDLILLQVKPSAASADWQPTHCYNIISDPRIPASTYAKALVDTASSLGQAGDKGFFKTQAQTGIEKAMELLKHGDYEVTLSNVFDLLMNNVDPASGARCLDLCLEELRQKPSTPERAALINHFRNFAKQPPEQLEGVKGTIQNYLNFFQTKEIAQVFCTVSNSFEFSEIDRGKIICVAMPQKFQAERRYICTILKMLFYTHALSRFDKSPAERAADNLILLCADEAQQFVSAAEDGMSDYNTVDRIREAQATIIAATQSTTSFVPPLGRDKARVFALNLSNRLIFQSADEEDAKEAADFIGKREVVKRSWGYSGGRSSTNYNRVEEHYFKPHQLRAMKKFQCVVVHAEKGYRRTLLEPIEPDGKVSSWYRKPLLSTLLSLPVVLIAAGIAGVLVYLDYQNYRRTGSPVLPWKYFMFLWR